MNIVLAPQEQMDTAFDNYITLSDALREDLLALLETESSSQCWRRNYIRVSASLIEGYAHCFREMCAVSFECIGAEIGEKEAEAVRSERHFNANERIKLTLRAAYKIFELQPEPNFGGPEWQSAQCVFKKRHLLMHPKTLADLDVSNEQWLELRDGVTWLIEQISTFIAVLQAKHGG